VVALGREKKLTVLHWPLIKTECVEKRVLGIIFGTKNKECIGSWGDFLMRSFIFSALHQILLQ
jgi:hypothetical protein